MLFTAPEVTRAKCRFVVESGRDVDEWRLLEVVAIDSQRIFFLATRRDDPESLVVADYSIRVEKEEAPPR